MKRTVTYEPYTAYGGGEHDQFQQMVEHIDRMITAIETFADNPHSAHGIANLSDAIMASDDAHDLMGSDSTSLSYPDMERLQRALRPVSSYYYRVKGRDDVEPTFRLGRQVERTLDRLEALRSDYYKAYKYAQ